ncbi:MAG: DUF2892 domain-containing protein [Leptospirales bacterium]|nr:DUF2892 domain-containing protein [Leptospirales bacterium]
MMYQKNVPGWERILRLRLAAALVGAGILSGNMSLLLKAGLVASGVFIAATAFFGWCPACAMLGRKLRQNELRKS